MTRSVRTPQTRWLPLLVLFGLLVGMAGGCDSGGSKRSALYQELTGTWNVKRLRLDNSTIPFDRRAVQIEFVQQDERRLYRLIRDSTSTVEGSVEVLENNILSMTSGFGAPLVWRFDFEEPDELSGSVRFQLERARQESIQAFLQAIGESGGADRVGFDLERE